MGQVQENTRGNPTKMGQNGVAQGAAAPPLAPFGMRLGWLMLTALPNVSMVVSPRFNVLGGRFGTFHMGMKHFPNAPSSPPIRGGPSSFENNTSRQELHHKSITPMALGPI
jgi:hypothetical protein